MIDYKFWIINGVAFAIFVIALLVRMEVVIL